MQSDVGNRLLIHMLQHGYYPLDKQQNGWPAIPGLFVHMFPILAAQYQVSAENSLLMENADFKFQIKDINRCSWLTGIATIVLFIYNSHILTFFDQSDSQKLHTYTRPRLNSDIWLADNQFSNWSLFSLPEIGMININFFRC